MVGGGRGGMLGGGGGGTGEMSGERGWWGGRGRRMKGCGSVSVKGYRE
jgi:hypothetical protein